jgi:hypothetical protein
MLCAAESDSHIHDIFCCFFLGMEGLIKEYGGCACEDAVDVDKGNTLPRTAKRWRED